MRLDDMRYAESTTTPHDRDVATTGESIMQGVAPALPANRTIGCATILNGGKPWFAPLFVVQPTDAVTVDELAVRRARKREAAELSR